MKRLTFIVVFLFCALGTVLWAARNFSGTWEPLLRTKLEEGFSKTLRTRVRIDSISLVPLRSIRLHNVQIWDPNARLSDPPAPNVLAFRAAYVDVTFSFIDLPGALIRNRPVESIGHIQLEAPTLNLSQSLMDHQKALRQGDGKLPLLFTVSWDHGVLRWKDSRAPHGAWTLYQTRGLYRIRGPKTDLNAKGSMEQAEQVRVQFGTLGKRWNGLATVRSGQFESTQRTLELLLNRPVLPKDWNLKGRYQLEVQMGGRRLPHTGEKFWQFLEDSELSLSHASLTIPQLSEPIDLHGSLKAQGQRIQTHRMNVSLAGNTVALTGSITKLFEGAMTDLQAHGPHLNLEALSKALGKPTVLQGQGNLEVTAKGPLSNLDLASSVAIPEGQLWGWPFLNALFKVRYVNHHWEIAESGAELWGGRVTTQGVLSEAGNELQVTGSNLQFEKAGLPPFFSGLQGGLNFSSVLRGNLPEWRMAGSLWLSNYSWGAAQASSVRGDFELSPDRFQAQAMSEDRQFRISTYGNRSDGMLTLDRLEVRLPSGALIQGDATLTGKGPTADLRGKFSASAVSIPRDTPFLKTWAPSLKGSFAFEGRLGGTLQNPSLSGEGNSDDLLAGTESLAPASASVSWKRSSSFETRFHFTPGLDGSWSWTQGASHLWDLQLDAHGAPASVITALIPPYWPMKGALSGQLSLRRTPGYEGSGELLIRNGELGKWPVESAKLDFKLRTGLLTISTAQVRSSHVHLDLRGKGSWNAANFDAPIDRIRLEADGRAKSSDGSSWEIPLDGTGEILPSAKWVGNARLKSGQVLLRGSPTDPLHLRLEWDAHRIAWREGTWGKNWNSEGTLQKGRDSMDLAGQVALRRIPASLLSSFFFPHVKEMPGGLVSGNAKLGGTLANPSIDMTAQLEDGRWRAFRFNADFKGTRSSGGWRPLSLSAKFPAGGNLDFQGSWAADQTVRGALKVSELALDPFAESFTLPKPLSGAASATLTVAGPIDRLQLTGHFEGRPVVYGTVKPLRLELVSFDAGLAKASDSSKGWKLTFTEGIAKTAEEQVRVNQGSFIELGGEPTSELNVGMQIRNLHLGIFTVFGGLDVAGTWSIKPDGFAIQSDAYTRSLFINDYELEEGRLRADYYNGVLKFTPPPKGPSLITGGLDFQRTPQLLFDDFHVSGKDGVGLRVNGEVGPTLWDFRLAGRGLDIGTLSGLAGFPYPLSGTAELSVRGTGDLRYPHLEGTIDLRDGSALGLAYRSGSAQFVWQDNRMTFTKLQLSDPGRYTLSSAGVFPLTGAGKASDKRMDFTVRLKDSNVGLLKSLSPEVKEAKGSVQGILQITGTSDAPLMHGSVRVTNGDVVGAHYFRHLRDFHLDAAFEEGDLVIRELRGRSGDGVLFVRGRMGFNGFKPKSYDLQADVISSAGLDIQVPELAIPESPLAKRFRILTTISRCDVRGHVTFKGPADSPIFAGEALFSKGHFTFPPSRKAPPPPGFLNFVRAIHWDVALKFQDGAFFENELMEASLVGELKLKGPGDKLRVDGGMDINEGKISYLGVQFDIEQARFDMRSSESGGAIVNTPYVRGIAESQVQAVNTVSGRAGIEDPSARLQDRDTVTLTVDYAPINQIKPRLASRYNPNMSQEKLLARVTQLDTENLTPQERNYLYQQQMVSLIDNSLATPLAKNILKRTGLVDNFRVTRVIDPASAPAPDETPGQAAQNQTSFNLLANTKYTVEKNLGSRLSLGYGVRFIENVAPDTLQSKLDLVNDVELSYRWFRNVYLRGTFDLPSSNPTYLPDRKVTIEPRWRFGWWGNTNKPKPKADTPATPSKP